MSNDFEVVREFDDFESDQPDPEEPSTWQHAQERSDAEIDALDWAEQHSTVEDPLSEEDAPESEGAVLSVDRGIP